MALTDEFKLFDDLLKVTNKSDKFLLKVGDALKRAEEIRVELLDRLWKVQHARRYLSDDVLNTTVYDTAFEATLSNATAILVENVDEAARSTVEYSDPVLLQPLLKAADSDDNFSFRQKRNGMNSSLDVTVDMNRTAGDLESWANAVQTVREIYGSMQKSPARASEYWKSKVYHKTWKGGSYLETIADRFAAAGELAPYWSLLNDGNSNVKMSSDWGGTPYPSNQPTGFIQKTEQAIKQYFVDTFWELAHPEVRWLEEDPEVRKLTDKLDNYIEKLKKVVDDFAGIDFGGEPNAVDAAVGRLSQYYEEQDRAIDKEKLRLAVIDAIEHPNKERFELTLKGTKRTRIRGKKLRMFIQGAI